MELRIQYATAYEAIRAFDVSDLLPLLARKRSLSIGLEAFV